MASGMIEAMTYYSDVTLDFWSGVATVVRDPNYYLLSAYTTRDSSELGKYGVRSISRNQYGNWTLVLNDGSDERIDLEVRLLWIRLKS